MPDTALAKGTVLPPALPPQGRSAGLVIVDDSDFANLLDTGRFEHIWRVANVFAQSGMVPKMFQGKPEACFVGVQMAVRLKVDPFMMLQNIYLSPDGKPALYGQMAIALINARGPFEGQIQFALSGTPGKDDYACTAWGVDRRNRERCEVTVSVALAKAEGWYGRNKKWQTIPEMMLRYRSGAWLGRVYAPECLMGMLTTEEREDEAAAPAPPRPSRQSFQPRPVATPQIVDEQTGEILDDAGTDPDDSWDPNAFEAGLRSLITDAATADAVTALIDEATDEMARLDQDRCGALNEFAHARKVALWEAAEKAASGAEPAEQSGAADEAEQQARHADAGTLPLGQPDYEAVQNEIVGLMKAVQSQAELQELMRRSDIAPRLTELFQKDKERHRVVMLVKDSQMAVLPRTAARK